MASIRFPKVGTIVVRDGVFDVGPALDLGGPFDTAAEYFVAWAKTAEFPSTESEIRSCTSGVPSQFVEEALSAILSFSTGVQRLTERFRFRDGPFPLIHPDLYSGNIIIDTDYNVLSVIDWEDAFVGPWELVEFTEELTIPAAASDGLTFTRDVPLDLARAEYLKLIRILEEN